MLGQIEDLSYVGGYEFSACHHKGALVSGYIVDHYFTSMGPLSVR